jgi:hypothetical protein
MPWFLLLQLLRKSSGDSANVATLERAQVKFQPIFKLKSPVLSSQVWFSCKEDYPDYTAASFLDFKRREKAKRHPARLPIGQILPQ